MFKQYMYVAYPFNVGPYRIVETLSKFRAIA